MSAIGENTAAGTSAVNIGDITTIIQAALGPLVSKVQELEEQLGRSATVAVTAEDSAPKNVLQVVEMLPQQERPSFSGGTQNPIAFLEELKDYIRKVKRTDALNVVKENFKGEAKSWLKLYSKRWQTLEDFEQDFLANYWGDIKKNAVRRRLAEGCYDAKRGTSMLAHFATYWELAKALKITDTSEGIVNEIMRHFPKETQSLWFSGEMGDEIAAAELLRRLDNMVCDPEERQPRKRENDENKKIDKYRERYNEIKRRIHSIESASEDAGCSKCTETPTPVRKEPTPEASGKEICVVKRPGNYSESSPRS